MSGHNPHGRLGQPNPSWNHLQVPSYIPRQPQLAHMSNERPIVRSPPTWHTPIPTEAALFNFMAAANHKTPLELKPLLPSFVTPTVSPFGSVDLTISTSARNSLTPSPRNLHSPGLNTNISSPPPDFGIIKNSTNNSITNRNISPTPGVIQTTSLIKDKLQCSILNNGDIPTATGGLFIRDANQINNDITKLQSREPIGLPPMNEPVELVREAIFHSMKNHSIPLSPPRKSPARLSISEPSSPGMHQEPPPTSHSSVTLLQINEDNSHIILNDQPPPPTSSPSLNFNATSVPLNSLLTPSLINDSTITNMSSPINNTNTSEDSVDSNASKKRRKRKPNKTTRMSSDSENNINTNSSLENMDKTLDDNIKFSQDSDKIRDNNKIVATSITEDSVLESTNHIYNNSINNNDDDVKENCLATTESNNFTTTTLLSSLTTLTSTSSIIPQSSSTPPPAPTPQIIDVTVNIPQNITKIDKNDIDECETIDKIAEMIANTDNNKEIVLLSPTKLLINNDNCCANESDLEKTLNGTICDNKNSFEEVENKLEEMFAGIVDERTDNNTLKKLLTSVDLDDHDDEDDEHTVLNVNNKVLEKTEIKTDEDENNFVNSLDSSNKAEVIENKTLNNSNSNKGIKRGKTENDSSAPINKKKKKSSNNSKINKNKSKNFKSNSSKSNHSGGSSNSNSNSKSSKLSSSQTKDKQKSTSSTSTSTVLCKENESDISLIKNNRGPFIHVRSDGEITVINAPNIEEELEKTQNKLKTKKQLPGQTSTERNQIRGLHVSTLSMKYDADTTDVSWMCVFCKMGPHKKGLGDLFGPYILTTTSEDFQLSQIDPMNDVFKSKRTKQDMIQKYIGGKRVDMPSASGASNKKKKKLSESCHTPSQPEAKSIAEEELNIFTGMSKAGESSYEVWVHEDCAVWASGVHIIGVRIVGLEASIWSSSRHKCKICLKNGAMLCCLQRGCSDEAHIPCAKLNNWILNDIDFKSYCEKHNLSLSS